MGVGSRGVREPNESLKPLRNRKIHKRMGVGSRGVREPNESLKPLRNRRGSVQEPRQ